MANDPRTTTPRIPEAVTPETIGIFDAMFSAEPFGVLLVGRLDFEVGAFMVGVSPTLLAMPQEDRLAAIDSAMNGLQNIRDRMTGSTRTNLN